MFFKILWHEIGGLGTIALSVVLIFLGIGETETQLLRSGLIVGSILLFLIYQIRSDRKFILAQVAHLPNAIIRFKRCAFLFTLFYILIILGIRQLFFATAPWQIINVYGILFLSIYYSALLLLLHTKDAYLGLAFTVFLFFYPSPVFLFFAISFAISTLLFFPNGKLKKLSKSVSISSHKNLNKISPLNYIRKFTWLVSQRNDSYRGNFNLLMSLPLVLIVYLDYAIMLNESFKPLFYGVYLLAMVFIGFTFYCLILISSLRPLLQHTLNLNDIKNQLAKWVRNRFLAILGLIIAIGSFWGNWSEMPDLAMMVISASLYLTLSNNWLMQAKKYYFWVTGIMFLGIVLLVSAPIYQIGLMGILFILNKIIHFRTPIVKSNHQGAV